MKRVTNFQIFELSRNILEFELLRTLGYVDAQEIESSRNILEFRLIRIFGSVHEFEFSCNILDFGFLWFMCYGR